MHPISNVSSPALAPMAYDLAQLCWVDERMSEDGSDEVEVGSLTHGTRLRSVPVAAAHGRFDAQLARALRGPLTPARSALFALASEVVASEATLPAADRLPTLRELHRRVVSRTDTVPVPDGAPARVALRPWRRDEARTLRALLDDGEVWRYLPDPQPAAISDEVALALIERAADAAEHTVRAIEEAGRVVGQARLHLRSPHAARGEADGELSYWLGRAHWGQGIASAVIPHFTRAMFLEHGLTSVFARVDERNGASLRALEKAGFLDEGDLAAESGRERRIRTLRAFRRDYVQGEDTTWGLAATRRSARR